MESLHQKLDVVRYVSLMRGALRRVFVASYPQQKVVWNRGRRACTPVRAEGPYRVHMGVFGLVYT